MTVATLRHSMSMAEFGEWVALYDVERAEREHATKMAGKRRRR